MITRQADTDWSERNGYRAHVVLSAAGETLTATLSGELDRFTVEDVIPAVAAAVAAGTSCLVIDLGGLTFMDSSGIHAVVKLHRALGAEGIDVRLAVPADAPVRRTLEVANVVHLIDAVEGLSNLARSASPRSD